MDPRRLFIISDTHFYHDNIVKFQGRDEQLERLIGPDRAARIDHNEFMVERWNSVVRPHDRVLHLGDLYFWRGNGPQKFARHVAPRLNGAKFLVMGNHDRDDPEVYECLGFQVVEPFALEIDGVKVSFDHYPYSHDQSPEGLHIHGHIHNNGYPITADWQDGTVPRRPNQINVSVEVIDFTPVRLRSLLSPRCPSVSEAPEESADDR